MASEAAEWFVFTVVRDPLLRLVSAWELLVLLEDLHLKVMGRWTPEMAVSSVGNDSAFAEGFQAFVSSSELKILAEQDPHFIPQNLLLAGTPVVPKVFHLENLEALQQALRVHFGRLGLPAPEIAPANERLISRSLWDLDRLDATQVHEIYAEDYLKYGYSTDASRTTTSDAPEREELVSRSIVRVRESNRRIHHLWSRSAR